jgi:hypothetical protein
MPILMLIVVALFVFTVVLAIAEAIVERDFPRDTFKFVLWTGGLLVLGFYIL